MKHMFTTIVLLTLVACTAEAQPKLVMQDTVDWGKVVPNAKLGEVTQVTADVKMVNAGDALLRIEEVRPGCGCTSAPLDKDSLAPGEETMMRVSLNLPQSNGPLMKTISVRTNDPLEPARVITLKVEVQRPIQLSSSFIPFNKGRVGDVIEGVVTITAAGNEPVTVTCTSTQSNLSIINPMPMVVQPGTSQDLKVTYAAKNPGPFSVQVYIKTNLKGYESFDLQGYGVVDP